MGLPGDAHADPKMISASGSRLALVRDPSGPAASIEPTPGSEAVDCRLFRLRSATRTEVAECL
jgi:hypothetical protein